MRSGSFDPATGGDFFTDPEATPARTARGPAKTGLPFVPQPPEPWDVSALSRVIVAGRGSRSVPV